MTCPQFNQDFGNVALHRPYRNLPVLRLGHQAAAVHHELLEFDLGEVKPGLLGRPPRIPRYGLAGLKERKAYILRIHLQRVQLAQFGRSSQPHSKRQLVADAVNCLGLLQVPLRQYHRVSRSTGPGNAGRQ